MGSTLVAEADSKQDIIDILSKDIYATSGVWDIEKVRIPFALLHDHELGPRLTYVYFKVQIYPFKCAFRNP